MEDAETGGVMILTAIINNPNFGGNDKPFYYILPKNIKRKFRLRHQC